MANHCKNVWQIKAITRTEYNTIKKTILNEQGEFDYNRLIPAPDILRCVRRYTPDFQKKVFDGVAYDRWYDNGIVQRVLTEDEEKELDGINDKSWFYDNWMQRGNAMFDKVHFIDDVMLMIIVFNSYHHPPYPIVKAFIDRFPNANLKIAYHHDSLDDDYGWEELCEEELEYELKHMSST